MYNGPVVKFTAEHSNARLPERAHDTDAGYDLYSVDDLVIYSGERAIVRTGLTMELPGSFVEHTVYSRISGNHPACIDLNISWEAQIRPRSGLAFKKGITVINSPGTIDAGYRGPLNVILANHGSEPFVIKTGDRIAQLVFNLTMHPEIIMVDKLNESDRNRGGFGSTGVTNE